MDLEVRNVAEGDRAPWEVLWKAYIAFYKVDLAPEITGDVWRRVLDPGASVQGLVAVGDGALSMASLTITFSQLLGR